MHRTQQRSETAKTDDGLRRIILEFIADFSNWKNAAQRTYLDASRALVKAAHGDEAPLVVDPFAGGGSIPLEALRVGCEAFASDLNPVACLILKVLLEQIPRQGTALGDEIRQIGRETRDAARNELAGLYPEDEDGSTPITYLWARTVECEAPKCGAEIPLMLTRWLCKKDNRKRALRAKVTRRRTTPPEVELEIFEPKKDEEVEDGTVKDATATCVCCGAVLPPDRVRAQLSSLRGGADVIFDENDQRIGGARMIAVVTLTPGVKGRQYRQPTAADYAPVRRAQSRLVEIVNEWEEGGGLQGFNPVPDEETPSGGGSGAGRAISLHRYGMYRWDDVFSARQKVAMDTLRRFTPGVNSNGELLSLVLTRMANAGCSLARWNRSGEKHEGAYARQALPIIWDYSEVNPLSDSTGGYSGASRWVAKVAEAWPGSDTGQVQQADATDHPLPDESAAVWFTDPPYYDAVPYADLSDLFLVWLKRALPGHPLLYDPFDPSNPLSPKAQEAVQDERKEVDGRTKDQEWFEETMAAAFTEGRRVLQEDGVGSVVFAHKTTEGWEALLSGMIRAHWIITGSWPIATEMKSRLRAQDSAALATSVHLVCRPRPEDAPVGDWADVLRELPIRVGNWMEHLQEQGVRGADLVFACVGPALEIFSRYSRVETADGQHIELPTYLERVWEVVGRIALENVLGTEEAQARNGQAGVLEEDARLTALFLWTTQNTEGLRENQETENGEDGEAAKAADKRFRLPFDVVRRFAQPMGINLDKWTGRIIEQRKGVVRLLPVARRVKDLFGKGGARHAAEWLERDPEANVQPSLFPDLETPRKTRTRRRGKKTILEQDAELQAVDATVLDRIHAAMLLQSSGHSNALRKMIEAEQDRGPDFLRLANALSALYPRGSEEKRLLDGMLLAVPR